MGIVDPLSFVRIIVSLIVALALPVGIVVGIVALVRRGRSAVAGGVVGEHGSPPGAGQVSVEWDRVLLYVLAFAGLLAVLFAVYGLLALGVGLILQNVSSLGTLVSASDARTQAASDLAALIVGAALWLACWRVLDRRLVRAPAERNALERRLFLAATFAVTSIVALFALHTILHALLTLPGSPDHVSSARDAVEAGARLLVYGAAWLVYARLGWRERSPRTADAAHDVAVYLLAGFSLIFLCTGLGEAIHHLVLALQGTPEDLFPIDSTNATWTTWGNVAAWTLAGGLMWGAIWRYDLRRGGARMLRVVYLYLILASAAPTTAIAAGNTLFELLRRGFGYGGDWGFLADALPPLLVAGAVCAYHWSVVRRQASLIGTPAAATGGILWPRRLAIAVLSLSGLAAALVGAVALVWVGIDAILGAHAVVDGAAWWRDRLSGGLASDLVGLAIWLPAWILLQRAAEAAPKHELAAWERRWLLAAVVLGSALAATGFASATLYEILRGALQTPDANALSNGLQFGSAAAILAAVAAYHFQVFRRDRRLREAGPRAQTIRVLALLASGAEGNLAELKQRTGLRVEVLGHLANGIMGPEEDLESLQAQLASPGQGDLDQALLILGERGGILHAYSRSQVPLLQECPHAEEQVAPTSL
jgi:hypothetical protein